MHYIKLPTRSPVLVFLLSVLTFGIYLIYWYYRIYAELEQASGDTPTGNSFFLDLLLAAITGGIWAIYVDYKIGERIAFLLSRSGHGGLDTRLVGLVLDLAAYVTFAITFLLTSSIHQAEMNRLAESFRPPPGKGGPDIHPGLPKITDL